jgi:hypothetical protein
MCKRNELLKELKRTAVELLATGENDLKVFEIAFQEAIEKVFANRCWWQVTTCNIFMELLEYKEPFKVIASIYNNLKEVY